MTEIQSWSKTFTDSHFDDPQGMEKLNEIWFTELSNPSGYVAIHFCSWSAIHG